MDLLAKIQKGEKVAGIEKDPLSSESPDLIVDYDNLPMTMRREESVIPG